MRLHMVQIILPFKKMMALKSKVKVDLIQKMAQQNTGASQAAKLTRQGQLNSANDARALYLKLFSGEMFKGFQHESIARDMVMKRTLKNGSKKKSR